MFCDSSFPSQILCLQQPLTKYQIQKVQLVTSQSSNYLQVNTIWEAINQNTFFWQNAYQLMQTSSETVLMMILCLVGRRMQVDWRQIQLQLKSNLKKHIGNIISQLAQMEFNQLATNSQINILKKLDSIVVEIVKCQWQTDWPHFIKDICIATENDQKQALNSLRIFRMIFQEIFAFPQQSLTRDEINNLRRQIELNITSILKCLETVWMKSLHQKINQQQCIISLMTMIKWISPYYVFLSTFLEMLQKMYTINPKTAQILACYQQISKVQITSQLLEMQSSIRKSFGRSMIELLRDPKTDGLNHSQRSTLLSCFHIFISKSNNWLTNAKLKEDKQFCCTLIRTISNRLCFLSQQPSAQAFQLCQIILTLAVKISNNSILISQIAQNVINYFIENICRPAYCTSYFLPSGQFINNVPSQQEQQLFKPVVQLAKIISQNHLMNFNGKMIFLIDCLKKSQQSISIKTLNSMVWTYRLIYRVSSNPNDQCFLSFIDLILTLRPNKTLTSNMILYFEVHLMEEPLLLRRKPYFSQNYLRYFLAEKMDLKSNIGRILIFDSLKNICMSKQKGIVLGAITDLFLEKFLKNKLHQLHIQDSSCLIFYTAISQILNQSQNLSAENEKYLIKILQPSIQYLAENLQKQSDQILFNKPLLRSALKITKIFSACHKVLKFIPKVIEKSLENLQNMYIYYSQQQSSYQNHINQLINEFKHSYIEFMISIVQQKIFLQYIRNVSEYFIVSLQKSSNQSKQPLILQYLSILLTQLGISAGTQLCDKAVLRVIKSMGSIVNNDIQSYPNIRLSFFTFIKQITKSLINKLEKQTLEGVLEQVIWMLYHNSVTQIELGIQSARNIIKLIGEDEKFGKKFTENYLIGFVEKIFEFLFKKYNPCFRSGCQVLILILRQVKGCLSIFKTHHLQSNTNTSVIYNNILRKVEQMFPNKIYILHERYLKKILDETNVDQLHNTFKDYAVLLYRNS